MKAVILAGGTGTRLWPLSRLKQPKQFQALTGENTMLEQTVQRLSFLNADDLFLATNEEFLNLAKTQANRIPEDHFIVEPALRDTASCIGLAAAVIAKKFPDEVMAVIYADHLIRDQEEFEKKLRVAEQVAREENTLNIIEVKAKTPNVNLGYVKVGHMLRTIDEVEVLTFERFIEKPDQATAEKLLESYKYLWNTGIYVWKVSTILEAYKNHLPDTYERLLRIQAAWGTPEQDAVLKAEYSACQKISIDYAIMEKVKPEQVRIIPADLGWSDVGTWISLHEERAETPEANVTHGKVLNLDTHGSILHNMEDKKLVVALGLKDIVVINTDDVVFVCDKNKSHDVKRVIEALKAQKRDDLL